MAKFRIIALAIGKHTMAIDYYCTQYPEEEFSGPPCLHEEHFYLLSSSDRWTTMDCIQNSSLLTVPEVGDSFLDTIWAQKQVICFTTFMFCTIQHNILQNNTYKQAHTMTQAKPPLHYSSVCHSRTSVFITGLIHRLQCLYCLSWNWLFSSHGSLVHWYPGFWEQPGEVWKRRKWKILSFKTL